MDVDGFVSWLGNCMRQGWMQTCAPVPSLLEAEMRMPLRFETTTDRTLAYLETLEEWGQPKLELQVTDELA